VGAVRGLTVNPSRGGDEYMSGQSGGGLRMRGVRSDHVLIGRGLGEMPEKMRYGRTDDAGVEKIDSFVQMGSGMWRYQGRVIPREMGEQMAMRREDASQSLRT